MTTERAIEVLKDFRQANGVELQQALDKAIEVMGNRDVIEKLEVRLRSLERSGCHPDNRIRINEVKDLIEAFKREKQL